MYVILLYIFIKNKYHEDFISKFMKTCIFTVIKNERLYVEEFIKYHLSLGIDHIFICEDIDSESHKDITDKYPQVTLCSITDVINRRHLESVLKMRESGKFIQGKYITH